MITLPNLLTLLRLAGAPVVIVLYHADVRAAGWGAAAVWIAMMLSDVLDGMVARRLGQSSTLGVYLDPVVDKITVLMLFYALALDEVFSVWLPHAILAREFLHSAVRDAAASRGDVVGANWMGKVKASLQTVLITWALLMPVWAAADRGAAALRLCAWAMLALAWAFTAAFAWRNRRFVL